MRKIGVLLAVLILVSCEKAEEDLRAPVDTILHNAKVITIDAGLAIASAVAISGDSIVAVGGEELLSEYAGENTEG